MPTYRTGPATGRHAVTVTTGADGLATVTFPAGLFGAAPVVQLTAVSPAGSTLPTVAEIITVSASQVQVKAWRMQSQGVLVGGTIVPAAVVAATVHVLAVLA